MRTLSSAVPMATESPIYDLTLLLSADAEEDRRRKILADVKSAISSAGGSIERDDDWGRRPPPTRFAISPRPSITCFSSERQPTLIEELSHTLRITDGVLRFRVIKLRPGTPAAPSSPPPVVAAATVSSSAASSAAPASAGAGASASPDPAESGDEATDES